MIKKRVLMPIGLLGLALLLTGCAGLLTRSGVDCPACRSAIPAVPSDPGLIVKPDPIAVGKTLVRGDHLPGELVVGYLGESVLGDVLSLVGGSVERTLELGELKAALVRLPGGTSVEEALGQILIAVRKERIPGLAFAEPNYLVRPVEPTSKGGLAISGLKPSVYDPEADLRPYQWGLDVVGAEAAWAQATGAGVVVAVIDTGVDGTHPDLAGKVIDGYDPVANAIIPAGSDSDFEGHGTHVAGIIAANDDGKGVVGLAPDALIMPIPIFQPDYVDDFTTAVGLVWAVDNGADVLQNSWGGPVYSQLLKAVFDYAADAGVISVCAAGNEGEAWIHFPSAYPGVIAVGATTPDDTVTGFSTRGGWLSVAAPGAGILSSVPTWYVQDGTGDPLLYDYWDGTSMATPFVSALVAILRELHPAATPYQIKKIVENSAVDIEAPGFDTKSGYGRIDAAAAVTAPVPDDGATAYIYTPTASSMDLYGFWYGVPYVDVVLLQNGEIRYWAQTDIYGWFYLGFPYEPDTGYPGVAPFYGIEPGTYQVLVGGDDQVLWGTRTANRVTTTGTLTVGAGDFQELVLPINTELQVRIDWTGAGDVDLAFLEYDPTNDPNDPNDDYVWSTAKTGAWWGSFSGDDAAADGDGTETYTLGFPHWDYDEYPIAIDATNSDVDTTVTVTIIQNGVTEVYGPYDVTAGSFILLGDQTDWWDGTYGPWVF